MRTDRGLLEALFPGLDDALSAVPLMELEQRGGPGLAIFQEAGAPGLLVPKERGGIGASPIEALRAQRAIASRSPSVAIGTNMHHLSIASFVEHLDNFFADDAPEWALVQGIAEQNMLVSSALAEGRSGVSNMAPTLRASRKGSEFVLNGSKKPCSLSKSMNLFSGTAVIESDDDQAGCIAFVIVPAGTPGMDVSRFWESPILAGAESDTVSFRDVTIPEALVVPTGMRPGEQMDKLLVRGWSWFELLVLGVYIGVASSLVERVQLAGKGTPAELGQLYADVEGAMAAAERVADLMTAELDASDLLARILLVRYSIQTPLMSVSSRAAELLGGIAFITDPAVGYLVSATRVLAFHPPSRSKALAALAAHAEGQAFDTTVF
jgi:alkylation response protein AidB-like acyl-CoA dehydrogenase